MTEAYYCKLPMWKIFNIFEFLKGFLGKHVSSFRFVWLLVTHPEWKAFFVLGRDVFYILPEIYLWKILVRRSYRLSWQRT